MAVRRGSPCTSLVFAAGGISPLLIAVAVVDAPLADRRGSPCASLVFAAGGISPLLIVAAAAVV
eukprot:CAMPEP_0171865202 /NCGR_PEP_ID=MMETSP0992-20121227/29382_1 /TAXON_ID=483369 /ORGANISM="non described non described, Strain CCMP2098" /LENGTH=63 /DNA_ID=CAMNT_0012488059 /DNA_START=43 /DNA_END=231 /DNA_ORIENTATION=-